MVDDSEAQDELLGMIIATLPHWEADAALRQKAKHASEALSKSRRKQLDKAKEEFEKHRHR